MSSADNPSVWEMPKSYDLGVQYFYRNLLRGSPYVQAFVTTYISQLDAEVSKWYDYDQGKVTGTPPELKNGDPFDVSLGDVRSILDRAGVPAHLIEQMNLHMDHLQKRENQSIHLFKLKEFLAYCGIDGVYDLEKKKHFAVPATGKTLPRSIEPQFWIGKGIQDKNREQIAKLMAAPGEIYDPAPAAKAIRQRRFKLEREALALLEKDGVNREDVTAEQINALRPDVPALKAQEEEEIRKGKESLAAAMDKYAPLDPSHYPVLAPKFDRLWDREFNRTLADRELLEGRYLKSLAAEGITPESEGFVRFDHTAAKARSEHISDWIFRDFTLNKVNRGEMSKHSRQDVPLHFVDAVKAELEDGLLTRIGAPHRIAPTGVPGHIVLIANDTEIEEINLNELELIERIGHEAGLRNEHYANLGKNNRMRNEAMTQNNNQGPEVDAASGGFDTPPPNFDAGDPGNYDDYPNPEEPASAAAPEPEPAKPEEEPVKPEDGHEYDPAGDTGAKADRASYEHSERPSGERRKGNGNYQERKGADRQKSEHSQAPGGKQPEDENSRAQDILKHLRQMQGGGGGVPGMGMGGGGFKPGMPGGMGGMSFNLDFGVKALTSGMGALGRSTANGISSVASAMVNRKSGSQVSALAHGINAKVNQAATLRSELQSGLKADGSALAPEDVLGNWNRLGKTLESLKDDMKKAAGVPKKQMGGELHQSVSNAKSEVKESLKLSEEGAKETGAVGELAKEAKKQAQELAEAIAKLVKMILKALGLDKSSSPSP
ncbi:hypothetical protein ACYPKM_02930 [Pseudomonas aeruginosa]